MIFGGEDQVRNGRGWWIRILRVRRDTNGLYVDGCHYISMPFWPALESMRSSGILVECALKDLVRANSYQAHTCGDRRKSYNETSYTFNKQVSMTRTSVEKLVEENVKGERVKGLG